MRQERQIPHLIQDATPSGELDLRSNAKICELYVAGSYAGVSLPHLHWTSVVGVHMWHIDQW